VAEIIHDVSELGTLSAKPTRQKFQPRSRVPLRCRFWSFTVNWIQLQLTLTRWQNKMTKIWTRCVCSYLLSTILQSSSERQRQDARVIFSLETSQDAWTDLMQRISCSWCHTSKKKKNRLRSTSFGPLTWPCSSWLFSLLELLVVHEHLLSTNQLKTSSFQSLVAPHAYGLSEGLSRCSLCLLNLYVQPLPGATAQRECLSFCPKF